MIDNWEPTNHLPTRTSRSRTAYAQEAAAPSEGGLRAFGRKIVDGGSSILSHIPIVNRFVGNNSDKKETPAPAPAAAPAPESAAEEKQNPAEEPAAVAAPEETKTDAPAPAASEEAPAAAETETPAEEPAKEEGASSQ